MIITYSPKYAAYQKAIRAEQICLAEKMVANGSLKKQRKNPNDPARFVNKVAVTNEGEKAIQQSDFLRLTSQSPVSSVDMVKKGSSIHRQKESFTAE